MYKPHTDVLSFGEIGGIGEMTYRTVRFPRYELHCENGKTLLCPAYARDDKLIDRLADTRLTGQELLASLCNLYRTINSMDYQGDCVEELARWCTTYVQPYQIDTLYELATDAGYDYESYSGMIMRDGIFCVEDFLLELEPLYHTTCFHHALLQLINGNDSHARALYHEGRLSDGYAFFEKYKLLPARDPAFDDSIPASQCPFLQNPLDDLDYLQAMLLSLLPEFRMKLRKDQKTNRILFAADVSSVFDLAWYTLSRAVADDTPDYDLNPDSLFSSGTVLSCLHCGSFFVRSGPRQLYCTSEECKRARLRKNQRNLRNRKMIMKQK